MRKNLLSLGTLLILMSAPTVHAKASSPEAQSLYDKGIALYEKQKYAAARHEFAAATSEASADDAGLVERSAYYTALCGAQMHEADARTSLEHFLDEYPHSIYANDVRFALGVVMHDEGDYKAAYQEYKSVDPYELDFARFDEYNFRTGYAAYMCEDTDAAYNYFKNCHTDPLYTPHATYYIAYIDYTRGNLKEAKRGFQSIAESPAYAPVVPFYLLQIEFQEGNYPYVITNGVPLLAKSTEARQQEICRILSESYFRTGDYANALGYIENFAKLGGKMGREELYIEGFSNYSEGHLTPAIEQLSQVASGTDELAQNASFHLADASLQSGDKRKAMTAFGLAASPTFNPTIREEAMFNYGKLQYENGGGVFNEAITTLDRYLKEFPSSPRAAEAREVLLAAYFNSRNYDAAYDAIKQVANPDNTLKTALQKIAYFRALDRYEAGDYTGAMKLFDEADQNRYSGKYTALTKFWRAETYVRQGDYAKALPLYESYLSLAPEGDREREMAQYNLGYCYFNAQQWANAQNHFNSFIGSHRASDRMRADAYNRLGDIAFAGRQYSTAIDHYGKAIAMGVAEADYARFQRAVTYGLANQYDRKVNELVSIIGNSKGEYTDDAMFELGRTYVQHEKFNEGANILKRLVDGYPQSPFAANALSELGLIYQNLGRNNDALTYYKRVVNEYPTSPQAKDAMLGVKNIYVDQNDVDSYVAYAKESGVETNISAVERDSLTYAAADRVYQSRDYSRALKLMDNYIKQYPNGSYRADALYALGDCAEHAGDHSTALAAYEKVGNMPSNSYQNTALQKAATLRMNNKEYAAAAALYKKLSETASQRNMVIEALTGYLDASVLSGDLSAAGAAADEVLASNYAVDDLGRTAHFAKGRALQQAGNDSEALTHYRKAIDARTRNAAEARYHIASILYKQGKYKEAEKEVFAFSEQNLPYQYWMGKAFLVLGDVYVKQGDSFQAKATYQSIVDGYADPNDGVIDEARRKIETLK